MHACQEAGALWLTHQHALCLQDLFLETHGVKLGFMSAFVKASADALLKVPAVNGVIDGAEIIYRDYTDISIAVATPKGLVVPVLRNVDSLSFAEVEKVSILITCLCMPRYHLLGAYVLIPVLQISLALHPLKRRLHSFSNMPPSAHCPSYPACQSSIVERRSCRPQLADRTECCGADHQRPGQEGERWHHQHRRDGWRHLHHLKRRSLRQPPVHPHHQPSPVCHPRHALHQPACNGTLLFIPLFTPLTESIDELERPANAWSYNSAKCWETAWRFQLC